MQQNSAKLATFTNFIILINIIVYFLSEQFFQSKIIFGLNMNFLESNLYFQPLSSMFLHANVMHIFMNMFVLFQFGNLIESAKGSLFFGILYILGGIFTSLGTFVYIENFAPLHNVIGASGAISFILGYLAFADKHNRNGLVIWMLIISFGPLLIGENVAWYAHLIGFVFGFLMTPILPKQLRWLAT